MKHVTLRFSYMRIMHRYGLIPVGALKVYTPTFGTTTATEAYLKSRAYKMNLHICPTIYYIHLYIVGI